jgi:hypothetical protein
MRGYFSQEGSTLRLLYTYVNYSAVTGDKPQLYQINRNGATWDANGTLIGDGAAKGLYENAQKVCAIGTRGTYYSSNNGSTYSQIGALAPLSDQLNATGTDQSGSKLYLIRAYSSTNSNLVFTHSSDGGNTWTLPQLPIRNTITNMNYPKIAVKGDTIVAAWLEQPTTQIGINGYTRMMACVSTNGGVSFSNPDTLFKGTNFLVIPTSFDDNRADFDLVNYGSRFIIAYAAVLNNLANNQHTYIRELIFPVTTSLSEQKNNVSTLIFLPNPAKDYLRIEIPNYTLKGNEKIEIYNELGQLIINDSFNGTVDIGKLNPGNYIVKVQLQNGISTGKFTCIK